MDGETMQANACSADTYMDKVQNSIELILHYVISHMRHAV